MDKTFSGILERMKGYLPSKYDKSAGSYVHDVLSGPAIELETAYSELWQTAEKAFAATATGSDLDAVLAQYGFIRKSATYATGEVTVTGATDAWITAGSLVAAGRTLYEVQETAPLTDGTATVKIRAQMPGSLHIPARYEEREIIDENGEKKTENILVEEEYDAVQWVINPEYDPTKEYISRETRKEWAPVGLIGKLVVVDDGTCMPNEYCKAGENGIATKTTYHTGYRVLSRIDETHIKVLVK